MPSLARTFLALAIAGFLPGRICAQEPTQPRSWFVQASPALLYYHGDFGYSPAAGVQIALGRSWHRAFDGMLHFSYSRPSQSFLWLGEQQDLKTDWYRWQFAWRWRQALDRSSRFQLFVTPQAGWVYLHPHALPLNGGTGGTIVIAPKDEFKFSPALAGGLCYAFTERVAAYLQLEIAGLKLAQRRVNAPSLPDAWKPYRQLGAGLLLRF